MLNAVNRVAIVVFLTVPATAFGEGQVDEPDAFAVYRAAANAIVFRSPGATGLRYPDYPPFGPEWDLMAKAAWEQDGTARKLAHDASSIATAHISPATDNDDLRVAKNVADNLGDAALYQHFQQDDTGAIETLRDCLHLATVFRRNGPPNDLPRLRLASGIEGLVGENLCVIDASIHLSSDPADRRSLQVQEAHRLIGELLKCTPPEDQMQLLGAATEPSPAAAVANTELNNQRLLEGFRRENAIQIMSAISLACHIYQFEMHRWPASLQELVPAYLPPPPPDFWGDGKQPFGYVLISHGLPDGSDRPLTYCRCESPDGLFYRTDIPHYGFYEGDGSNRKFKEQKEGGKFYDIAAWTPLIPNLPATTQPLSSTIR